MKLDAAKAGDGEVAAIPVRDGIALETRVWRGGDRTPVLCIPGLTRNAADFSGVAPVIATTGRDVYAVSLRGRAGSTRDPEWRRYHALVYRDDIIALLDALGLPRAVFVGTSLGGIVTMLVNAEAGDRVVAAIVNDVGPELAPEGIARILGYVGPAGVAPDLAAAAARVRAINEVAFPGRQDSFWEAFARRTHREGPAGWTLDYDPAIARAMTEGDPPPELWAPFATLAGKPTLLVHGLLSDLLTAPIIDKMRAVHPEFVYCPVADVGHAPMLDEPEALAAVAGFFRALP